MVRISLQLLILGLTLLAITRTGDGAAPPKKMPKQPPTVQDELNRLYKLLSKLSRHTNRAIKETICIVPMVREPVCGSDGQTYDNRWLVECTDLLRKGGAAPKLTVAKKGEC
ncbi:hypothetical protein RP20_CCG023069 [Aedes albopictus]|nr:hypothetical protein RP20_CCG023069 [Aedes albopictus]